MERRGSSEDGLALITILLLAAAILGLASAVLIVSRSDRMITSNATNGARALWIASAGAEFAKGWVEANYKTAPPYPTPVAFSSSSFGGGSYTATVTRYPFPVVSGTPVPSKFRIVSSGFAADKANRTIEEIVKVFEPEIRLQTVNIEGTGTFVKISDSSGGQGLAIPSFTIDGRGHDRFGNPKAPNDPDCPAVSAVGGSSTGAVPTNVQDQINDLKCGIVTRANSYCTALGTGQPGKTCTPGLYWVRGSSPGVRYSDNSPTCDPNNSSCCKNLDLSAPQLRGTSVISTNAPLPNINTSWSPMYDGPFQLDTPQNNSDVPLIKLFTAAENTALQNTISAILDIAVQKSRQGPIGCITGDLDGVTRTYGGWPGSGKDPEVVLVTEQNPTGSRLIELNAACNNQASTGAVLNIQGDSVIEGTGILIVPRAIVLKAATFHWRGVILVLDDGDFRIQNPGTSIATCGTVLGAVVLQDNNGGDFKLDFRTVREIEINNCTNPFYGEQASPSEPTTQTSRGFSVKYSCDAVKAAMSAAMVTTSWTERYDGE